MMKRITTALIGLTLCIAAFGQAQILTRKEKLSDFMTKTIKVVLTDNPIVDQSLKDAVKNTWTISPYEYCSVDDFNNLRNDERFYFMIILRTVTPDGTPGVSSLNILKGTQGAKNINSMLWVTELAVTPSGAPNGREPALMPAAVAIIQSYIERSLAGRFTPIGNSVKGLAAAKGKFIIVDEEDLVGTLNNADRQALAERIGILPAGEADEIFMDGEADTAVAFIVAPNEPVKGATYWKIVIDSRTYEMYLYKKCRVKNEASVGFTKSDLKKFASVSRK